MNSILSMKAVRFFLVFSVSVWMAGGCLFGCSNRAIASGSDDRAVNQIEAAGAAHSCHHVKSSSQRTGVPSYAPAPRGTMKDCPLIVNATAAISKSNGGQLPDHGPITDLPLIENHAVQSNIAPAVSFIPNRGPTYLRCCVLLI